MTPETTEDHYTLYVQGTGGYSRLGEYTGTPGDIYDEMEAAMGEDSIAGIGDFVAAIFRRDGHLDVYYNANGTWTEGKEVYHRPFPSNDASDLMEALARLRADKRGEW